jgi:hypothetical protein
MIFLSINYRMNTNKSSSDLTYRLQNDVQFINTVLQQYSINKNSRRYLQLDTGSGATHEASEVGNILDGAVNIDTVELSARLGGAIGTFAAVATSPVILSSPAPAPAPAPAPVPAPAPAPAAPGAPNLAYALPANAGAYIYFTPGSGTVDNYEYTLDGGLSYSGLLDTSDILSPVYVSLPSNNVQYNIQLKAINSGGASGWSNTISVTPSNPAVPTGWLCIDPNNSSSYSGSGSIVNNLGSYGILTGTKTAAVTYTTGTGISRNVFDFNGSSSYISYGSFNFGNTFTISAWVYPRAKASINGLLTNVGPNVNTVGFKVAWNSWQSSDNRMLFEAGGPTEWSVPRSKENTVTMNEWQQLTYVFDKTNERILFYKNGLPVDTTSIKTAADIDTNNSSFYIGAYIGGSYAMNAQLGLLKVYNSTLNASQIYDDYNATKGEFGL